MRWTSSASSGEAIRTRTNKTEPRRSADKTAGIVHFDGLDRCAALRKLVDRPDTLYDGIWPMPPSGTSARQLRELLVHRIARGLYPIGVQLPGTREFAVEVGANRNTVAKVYGELAREGLVQIVPGRGAFVIGRIDASAGQEPSEQVAHLLDDAVSRARLFGLTREAVLELVQERISAIYDGASPRLVFVECNPYDAQLGSGELTTQLGTTVESVLLGDIPPSGAFPFDV